MRRRALIVLTVAAASAGTLLLGWPQPGHEISAGGCAARWNDYDLIGYLTVQEDYHRRGGGSGRAYWLQQSRLVVYALPGDSGGPLRSYSVAFLPACLTTVLVAGLWVAAARVVRQARAPAPRQS